LHLYVTTHAEGNKKKRRQDDRKGPGGLDQVDFGGNGECGYRAYLGDVGIQHRDMKSEEILEEATLDRLQRAFRRRLADHLEDTIEEWSTTWPPIETGTKEEEGGALIQRAEDIPRAIRTKQQKKVGCKRAFQAMAYIGTTKIIMFKRIGK